MSEQIKRGPLIQKKQKQNTLARPKPVLVTDKDDFKFSREPIKTETVVHVPIEEKEKTVVVPERKTQKIESDIKKVVPRKRTAVVGKNNNVKSIKVPQDLHIQIGILGKFMDENKTYAIISQLVDYYVANELTDRQQRQFEYMNDFLHDGEE